jgi:hypothetical protein
MRTDLFLLPHQIDLLQMNLWYDIEKVYNRLFDIKAIDCELIDFENCLKEYASIELGIEVNENNFRRVKRVKKEYKYKESVAETKTKNTLFE